MTAAPSQRFRRSFRRDRRGTAAIEFGMVAPFLIMLVLGIFEVGFSYIAQRMLATGVDAAARQIRTGELRSDNDANSDVDEKAFRNVLCNHHTMFVFDCDKLIIDVKEVASFQGEKYDKDEDGRVDATSFGFSPGGRSTINVVRVFYDWPVIIDWIKLGALNGVKIEAFPQEGTILMGGAAFLNEPYS